MAPAIFDNPSRNVLRGSQPLACLNGVVSTSSDDASRSIPLRCPVNVPATRNSATGTYARFASTCCASAIARTSCGVDTLSASATKYVPAGAQVVLRNNLLVYGLGGLVVPFLGIKLIDMLLVGLHLG